MKEKNKKEENNPLDSLSAGDKVWLVGRGVRAELIVSSRLGSSKEEKIVITCRGGVLLIWKKGGSLTVDFGNNGKYKLEKIIKK